MLQCRQPACNVIADLSDKSCSERSLQQSAKTCLNRYKSLSTIMDFFIFTIDKYRIMLYYLSLLVAVEKPSTGIYHCQQGKAEKEAVLYIT